MARRKILIAEDEELLRSLYEEEFQEEGFEVVTAGDGKEALHQLEKAKPDLAILDIAMPVMDGLEALRRIKEKHNGIPVVLHTSHPLYLSDAKARGADAFILKSVDLEELKEKVHQLLDKPAKHPRGRRRFFMLAKILFVDDDPALLKLYHEELTEEGYKVMLARNGKEAVSRFNREKPNLVVLDIRMPEMDGITALNVILGKNRQVPIIFNTAYPQYRENFMTWGAEAYVVKSPDLSELKQTIRQVLERRKTA